MICLPHEKTRVHEDGSGFVFPTRLLCWIHDFGVNRIDVFDKLVR
jgi:hypothetical protein